jgi:large subunit ribosomal protein L15
MKKLNLSKLKAPKGARHAKKRVGFGESSGHGKTSSRGGKGQSARTGGGVRSGFEGGQMPLYRRIPKYGFRSQGKILGTTSWAVVNVSALERFSDGELVSEETLRGRGCVQNSHQHRGVKILGQGELTKKLQVKIHAISESARQKIEKAGGTIEIVSR